MIAGESGERGDGVDVLHRRETGGRQGARASSSARARTSTGPSSGSAMAPSAEKVAQRRAGEALVARSAIRARRTAGDGQRTNELAAAATTASVG